MKKEKGLFKVPRMEIFTGKYFDLYKKDIVLDSIKVPNSSCDKFFIVYDRMVNCYKINVTPDDLPDYKNSDGSYSFYFDDLDDTVYGYIGGGKTWLKK